MAWTSAFTFATFISLVANSLGKPPGLNLSDPAIKGRADKIAAVACDGNGLSADKVSELRKCMVPPADIEAVFAKCRHGSMHDGPPIGRVCHMLTGRFAGPPNGPSGGGGPPGPGGKHQWHQCIQQQISQASESTKKALEDFRNKRESSEGQNELLSCMEKIIQ